MKIAVTADTHSLKIPQQLIDDFKSADLIIHAGDFCSSKDLQLFQKIKPLKAVCGNMDGLDLCEQLPEKIVMECEGVKIGVYHGRGPRANILEVLKDEFKKKDVDVVIFGHSHQPMNETIDGVLYFNPGSPNDTINAPYLSYGMLEVAGGKVKAKLIKVK